jgi:lactoylglutathione lyase
MEESLHFYKEIVGLKENKRFTAGPGVEIAFLGEEATQIELIYDPKKSELHFGSDVSWGFQTDSLDRLIKSLKEKGVSVQEGPIQPNPHTRFMFVQDPNGMKIQFVEHL